MTTTVTTAAEKFSDAQQSAPRQQGFTKVRNEIWRAMWKRFRKFEGWSATELRDFVDDLEAAATNGGGQ